jgi:thiol-disulfide isomerase/thioredoxin
MNWGILLLVIASGAEMLPAQASDTLTGRWDGTVQYGDYKIPFQFELTQNGQDVKASFFNGDDRVTSTAGRLTGDSLRVDFDDYATHLNATVSHGLIQGSYGGGRLSPHDFEATPHVGVARSNEKTPDVAGIWDLPTESSKGEHAWQLIVRQHGDTAEAAILRVDGDTGELTGHYANGHFVLSHFDGARASVLEIGPKQDNRLDVSLRDFHNPAKHFTAVKLDQAKAQGLPLPDDPDEHTKMRDWNEPFRFRFPDLSGKPVSNTDEQFRDKVVVVVVSGSWCPNCHDEAPYLNELYRKYHARGLEIVALDFEEAEQQKDPQRLQALIRKYQITYTYLLAGQPSELNAKISQAENLNSWPTTFFLGRDGRVRAIHAGFAAPASGPFHAALKKETGERIERLLQETTTASR